MSKVQFRSLFVVGPLLMASIVPSLLFGVLIGEWGTNLIWGSYFGLGWCLSAFASGSLVHDRVSTDAGLIWGWLALMPLYSAAGWLWERLSARNRTWAVALLALSFIIMVPAHTIMGWDEQGIHLPDYTLHLNLSY